jgi:hypothetical protein
LIPLPKVLDSFNIAFICPSSGGIDPATLYLNAQFKQFSRSLLLAFLNYSKTHNVQPIQQNSSAFFDAIRDSDGEESSVATIYSSFSADFETAMVYKNQMDNSFLQLLHDFPTFQNIDENNAWTTIMAAFDLGIHSTQDADWISIQNEILNSANDFLTIGGPTIAKKRFHITSYPIFYITSLQFFYKPSRLTLDEVWDCTVHALGLGAGSIIGIGALQKMAAQEGIQAVVVSVS